MTLQLSSGRPYKAYVKKLQNGFGIKTVNTLTGVENIFIITADTKKKYNSDKKIVDSRHQVLRPILSKFSEEMVSTTLSLPIISKPSYAINKILAHLEPYLRETKSDIAGFHIFKEDVTESSPNIQKTSVIFVANTEVARRKGVYFNIPGKLMNTFFVDGQINKEGKIIFKADSVIKPLTIVVSDYVLHINICYDSLSKTQTKTVGTQTKKRYVLSSSVHDNIPIYEIKSFLYSDLQVKPSSKHKFMEESDTCQTNLLKYHQDIQTVYFKNQTSYTSSLDKISSSLGDKSCPNTDEDNTKTESFEISSKRTLEHEDSLNSFVSYDSHSHQQQTSVLNHVKDENFYTTASVENKREIEENVKKLTKADKGNEINTFTLYENSSNYNIEIANSDNVFMRMEPMLFGNTSTKSASLEEARTPVKTANSYNNELSSSNVSIKDIKDRLNKTTLSLQQLYSVIELMEDNSAKGSSSGTAGYVESEQLKSKTDGTSQTIIDMTSQETLGDSTSTINSDQSVNVQEEYSKSNQSSCTTDYEKSLMDYNCEDSSSLGILCEQCGSFHYDDGVEGDCKIYGEKSIQMLEHCLSTINNGTSTGQEHFSKDVKNFSETANTLLPDEIENCGSKDHSRNNTQRRLGTSFKDSTMSYDEHNNYWTNDETSLFDKSNQHIETKLLSITNYLDNGAMSDQRYNGYTLYENKNHNMSDSGVEKLLEKTLSNKKEFDFDKISIHRHSLNEFERVLKVDSKNIVTIREIKNTSIRTISSNENCLSGESIEATAESNNSSQTLMSLNGTLEENNKDPISRSTIRNKNHELMDDIKPIEENNCVQKLKDLNTFFLSQPNTFIPTSNETKAEERVKLLYFTEVRSTKSCISCKKSLKSCHLNEKLGLKGKTTNSEPNTCQLKIKNLSSGDHLHENVLCKVSNSLEERLNTIGLFNNQSNFLSNKCSSSSTLHIIPSSQELIKLKSKEHNCQSRELLNKAHGKIRSESSNFEESYVKSQGNCSKGEDESLACVTKYSWPMTNFRVNKTDPNNNFKTAKVTTEKKNSRNKKQNSKRKKNKLFCFLI